MLEWLRLLHLVLALDGKENLVYRKLLWGEVDVGLENSELALRRVSGAPACGRHTPSYVLESCV